MKAHYDIVIIGAGHNGLVAAAYLARAGLEVLVLERNDVIGGATRSASVFKGVDARLSVYAYLVSLFPDKIMTELGLDLRLGRRQVASYTPALEPAGGWRELLLRSEAEDGNRAAFMALTGDDRDFAGYRKLQRMQACLADLVWPTLTQPLVAAEAALGGLDREGREAWEALAERPLGEVIERHIADDLVRGLVFTDAKIGVSTHPHDPTLLQNRVFLYHIIGRGTGEWQVPVGGMGAVIGELRRVALETGRVTIATDARVTRIEPGKARSAVAFERDGKSAEVGARFVLCNAAAPVLEALVGAGAPASEPPLEGSVFKINMLLKRLPRLRSRQCSASEAFAGTFHLDEGYAAMEASYAETRRGMLPPRPPGEVYCHTLTDDSILGEDLRKQACHTLTLFGLDAPYALFENDPDGTRTAVLERHLRSLNQFLDEPVEDCLALDADGRPCIEAKSPLDLESEIHLPRGNIFHGDLSGPFARSAAEAGQWGVETAHPGIYLCGSSALRGGCVSGIPGHNAARKVLEVLAADSHR